MSIDHSWTKLKELRRYLTEADPTTKIDETKLFRYLMQGLLEEYRTLKTVLDAQPNLSVDDKLDTLQRFHEEHSSQDTSALAARVKDFKKGNRYSPPLSRRHSSSSEAEGFLCFTCDSPNHVNRDCPYRQEARQYAIRLRRQAESHSSRSSSHRPRSSQERSPRCGRHVDKKSEKRDRSKSVHFDKNSQSRLKTKGKAYVADEQTDSEGDISTDSALEEYAAVTQDTASKISLDEWIPDTAASSNMTDNLKNFHGPLKPIPRRVIKVGGGRLFSRYIGVAEIRLKDGRSMRLKDCLYVPCLGANLLSARRICTTSKLRGAFDATKMYIHKNNKVLLLASFRDGVYIVDHIATDDHERAYGAQEVPQEAMEIDLTGDPAAAVSLYQASLMDEVAEP